LLLLHLLLLLFACVLLPALLLVLGLFNVKLANLMKELIIEEQNYRQRDSHALRHGFFFAWR
jgi:hypothetical protein